MADPNNTIFAGRYQLLNQIGVGGFGVVYKAIQLTTKQAVAIKVLHQDRAIASGNANEGQRFIREMEMIGKLQHPNIVRLLDAGQTEDGRMFTVLEFIEGEELKDYIQRKGRLSLEETIHLMTQVLDALSSAHKLGIVHRDLKPQNVMVTQSGMRANAMVLDFGIAGIVEDARDADYKALTAAGKIHGTPQYMAPEQIAKTALTPQTDLYAWGLIFLESITGQQAAVGSRLTDIIAWQISPNMAPIPGHLQNHPIADVLRGVLQKNIKNRSPNAEHVYKGMMAGQHATAPAHPAIGLAKPNPASLHSQKTAAFSMPTPTAAPPAAAPAAVDPGPWKFIALGALTLVILLLIAFVVALALK